MKNDLLAELFRHNVWANLKLLDACAGLSDAQFDASVQGTMGTLRETVKHIVGAEERYVGMLRDAPPEKSREREPWEGIDALRVAVRETGQALIEVAAGEEPGRILRGTRRDGTPYELPASLILTQAINHATDHRSHVCTILTQQGVEPPAIDGWAHWQAGR